MNTARLAPVEAPYGAEVAEDLAKLMPPGMEPLNLFRTVAHNPRALRRMRRGGLLDKGSISPREREIVILRSCARCGSEYEWGVHVAFFARAVGLTEAQVQATVLGTADDSTWSPNDRLLIRLADELHEGARVSDRLWSELSAAFRPDQLVELTMLAGLYHAVSYLTNAFQIENEKAAPGFPRRSAA